MKFEFVFIVSLYFFCFCVCAGLLKIGLRTAFAHISYLVEQYYDYVKSLKWKITTKEPWQYMKENSPREVISPEVEEALSRYFAPL